MITIETLCLRIHGLQRADLERWISHDWVRPGGEPGHPLFQDIDVARVALIRDLRDEMQVGEEAMPVVLRLLDQLYSERRRLRRLCDAVARTAPDTVRDQLLQHLRDPA